MVQRWARQSLLAVLGAAAVVALAAVPAAAERTVALGDDGVLVESGAEEVDRGALTAAVRSVRSSGVPLSVALLAEDPPGGAEAEADRLVEQTGGVVLVLTPAEVAAGSADHSDQQVDAGLDAAASQLDAGGDIPAGVETFGRELATAGGGGLDTTDLPGPLAGVSVQTLVIGAIVAMVVLSMLRRLLGGGRRRRGLGSPGGAGRHGSGRYGSGRYGSSRGRRRGGGGLAGGVLGGLAGGALRGRHRGGSRPGSSSRPTRSRGSASRSRSSSSRSRGSASRRR